MKPSSKTPMGAPEDIADLPRVGGTNYDEREDFEYARPVADPSDATKGDEPSYIKRREAK